MLHSGLNSVGLNVYNYLTLKSFGSNPIALLKAQLLAAIFQGN